MSPQPTIAHYRITTKLGAGGMGEVWRATDTRLNREVAIKILPDAFASDPDRMARFQREAQVLAMLNHPNIAAIYGVEDRALIMELVEGPTLAERIAGGPVPMEESLAIVRQIGEALEYAHDRGVVHRDLKPANIKVTPDGRVKVLDFGLAKAVAAESQSGGSPTSSPTLTIRGTQVGGILGTAGYMAPEQARGQDVDKRADIWAFGVLVYEMLTGKMLFQAETVSDTLAAVLRAGIDLDTLPADTPRSLRRLLRRCLERDRKRRLPDIAMVRLELDEPPENAAAVSPSAREPGALWSWWVAALLAVALAVVGAAVWLRPKPAVPQMVRFVLPWPEGTTHPSIPTSDAVASPDGRNLAMIAIGADGKSELWVRPMDETSAHRLDKTEQASLPFWSPDGQYLAFFADDKLKKIPITGGQPQVVCDARRPAMETFAGDGGTWNADGIIVFSNGADSPLMRVLAAGGPATPITKLDAAAGEVRHSWPQFLPDGRHILYLAGNADQSKGAIYVQELGSAQRILVLRNTVRGAWAPPGYLLFPKATTLYAQRMDPKTFRLAGEPVSLAEGIRQHDPSGKAGFDVSGNVLILRPSGGPGIAQLVWYGRDGTRQQPVGKPAAFTSVRLSPDDKSALATVGPPSHADLWTVDLATGGIRRVTNNAQASFSLGPWAPDSQHVAMNLYNSQGILDADTVSGSTRPLGPPPLYADDWSPDGQFLFCRDVNGDHWTLVRADGSQSVQPVANPSRGLYIRFAPNGKFVAYVSTASGRGEIVVASFPSLADKRQISVEGGVHPVWRKDGRELLFQSLDGTVMAAEIRIAGGRIEAGTPKALFPTQLQHSATSGAIRYWPSSDGQRFLTIQREQRATTDTVVTLNWAAGLK